MLLEWILPIEMTLVGENPFEVGPIELKVNGMEWRIEFALEPFKYVKIETEFCVAELNGIRFTLEENSASSNHKIESLCKNEDKLINKIVQLTNQVIKSFRVHGTIENLHEIIIFEDKKKYILESLNPKYTLDGENWTYINESEIDSGNYKVPAAIYSITKKIDVFNKFITASYNSAIYMHINSWERVVMAIIEQKSPAAELELAVNAREHWKSKNFRLAVLESVIGLEIVMSSFMRVFLTHRKGISKAQIDEFLDPNFSLYSRLSGLLNMTIKKKDLEKIDIAQIKKVVKWRNKIVHATGDLPDGIQEEQILEGVNAVINLVYILHNKKEMILRFPIKDSLLGDYV